MAHENEPQKIWALVRMRSPQIFADALADFLHSLNSPGLVIDDSDTEAIIIEAYFGAEDLETVLPQVHSYIAQLSQVSPEHSGVTVETEMIPDENWAIAWQDNFTPVRISDSLLVTPPWLSPDPDGGYVIIIEPAAAFGTGTHETTGSCMKMLEITANLALLRNPEASMCDVGCGSGILAITGAKLGLGRITALDLDPIAVDATLHNCRLNGLANEVEVIRSGPEALEGQYDIVAANLDPKALMANRERLIDLTSGYLIISGCPVDQWYGLKEDFEDSRIEMIRESLGHEWATGLYEKSI